MFKLINSSTLCIGLLFSFTASAVCTQYCKPGVSRACGNGCVSIHKKCRTPWTTACNGERPQSAKKSYDNPKKIEPKDLDNETKGE